MKRSRSTTRRQYPRVARINELLREILAEALERLDDDDLVLVTITGVHCDPDLRRAAVYFDGPRGAEGDEQVAEALEAVRYKLQRAIASQAQIKHTPELRFAPDAAVRSGEHIDEVLRNVPPAMLDEEGALIGDAASTSQQDGGDSAKADLQDENAGAVDVDRFGDPADPQSDVDDARAGLADKDVDADRSGGSTDADSSTQG